ncbi:hypothetical protein ACFFS0_33495, partial [Streptomyces coeruleoprunus]
QARFGRSWRRKAPVESLMPLRLAKYGVPLAETAPAGLAAAGIEPVLLPPNPQPVEEAAPVAAVVAAAPVAELPQVATPEQPRPRPRPAQAEDGSPEPAPEDAEPVPAVARPVPAEQPVQQLPQDEYAQPQPVPATHESPWFAAPKLPSDEAYTGTYDPAYAEAQQAAQAAYAEAQHAPQQAQDAQDAQEAQETYEFGELAYKVFRTYVEQNSDWPSADVLDIHLADVYNVHHPRSAALLRRLLPDFKNRYQAELEAEHIA